MDMWNLAPSLSLLHPGLLSEYITIYIQSSTGGHLECFQVVFFPLGTLM